ncbi:hypothetical protein CEUSTIGMA_g3044.t1 [Chlamydomonas eustigma]|uniref:protein-serine/threonine phosphatase n=1 Tax=Chlamydomonas eustigma TaxID=1157962 RepID=A0A250WYL9_9CHLO|nr:hypothetical protein CEUSTIGMA_g3044.t1 [Chlamydomonas eustigma]|eukprot:GAX75600.1 hypothetical protein CEUSTIGMA_g3044.t1 [Chlamydomonas eustigma]
MDTWQDSWVAKEQLLGSEYALFGVFDGHGVEGRAVSTAVSELLPKLLKKKLKHWDDNSSIHDIDSLVSKCFDECHTELHQRPGLNCSFSGSTCVTALISAHRLIVANVGDSRCILGRVSSDQEVMALDMTNDHNPQLLAEANRVLAAGGRIAAYTLQGKSQGPLRVWLRDDDIPGLAMTRSFGDLVAASVGVSHMPEILDYELTAEDKYLLLVSDGIHEHMASHEIVELVHYCVTVRQGMDIIQVSQVLVEEARRRWTLKDPSGTVDDCTALIILLSDDRALPHHQSNNKHLSTDHGAGDKAKTSHAKGISKASDFVKSFLRSYPPNH